MCDQRREQKKNASRNLQRRIWSERLAASLLIGEAYGSSSRAWRRQDVQNFVWEVQQTSVNRAAGELAWPDGAASEHFPGDTAR